MHMQGVKEVKRVMSAGSDECGECRECGRGRDILHIGDEHILI